MVCESLFAGVLVLVLFGRPADARNLVLYSDGAGTVRCEQTVPSVSSPPTVDGARHGTRNPHAARLCSHFDARAACTLRWNRAQRQAGPRVEDLHAHESDAARRIAPDSVSVSLAAERIASGTVVVGTSRDASQVAPAIAAGPCAGRM